MFCYNWLLKKSTEIIKETPSNKITPLLYQVIEDFEFEAKNTYSTGNAVVK